VILGLPKQLWMLHNELSSPGVFLASIVLVVVVAGNMVVFSGEKWRLGWRLLW